MKYLTVKIIVAILLLFDISNFSLTLKLNLLGTDAAGGN